MSRLGFLGSRVSGFGLQGFKVEAAAAWSFCRDVGDFEHRCIKCPEHLAMIVLVVTLKLQSPQTTQTPKSPNPNTAGR